MKFGLLLAVVGVGSLVLAARFCLYVLVPEVVLLVSVLYSFGCCTCCSDCLFATGYYLYLFGLVVGCLVVCMFIAVFGLFWLVLEGWVMAAFVGLIALRVVFTGGFAVGSC